MGEVTILAALLVIVALAVWYELRPLPLANPTPPTRVDDARYAWRGTVLASGKNPIVPVRMHNGILIDAKCKSSQQWSVVFTGRKVFGSIDADGTYIVEGME